jgi:hypothetical protein
LLVARSFIHVRVIFSHLMGSRELLRSKFMDGDVLEAGGERHVLPLLRRLTWALPMAWLAGVGVSTLWDTQGIPGVTCHTLRGRDPSDADQCIMGQSLLLPSSLVGSLLARTVFLLTSVQTGSCLLRVFQEVQRSSTH